MSKLENLNKLLRNIVVLLLSFNLTSCGLAYEKQITGRYYIISVDTKTDFGLGYRLSSGNYIGKAPGLLLEYGFNSTFLVAKTRDYKDKHSSYYIIDMTRDSELAHEEIFRVGPITEEKYNKTWKQTLGIQLKNIKY